MIITNLSHRSHDSKVKPYNGEFRFTPSSVPHCLDPTASPRYNPAGLLQWNRASSVFVSSGMVLEWPFQLPGLLLCVKLSASYGFVHPNAKGVLNPTDVALHVRLHTSRAIYIYLSSRRKGLRSNPILTVTNRCLYPRPKMFYLGAWKIIGWTSCKFEILSAFVGVGWNGNGGWELGNVNRIESFGDTCNQGNDWMSLCNIRANLIEYTGKQSGD